MMASAFAGLIVWFGFGANKPVTIGAAIFFIIGLIAFLGSGERKSSEKLENVHTDKRD